MSYWENTATEIDKMTVKEWLDKLTDENLHNDRLVVEAIIDGRETIIERAMLIRHAHLLYGHMPQELIQLREQLYKEMESEE